MILDTIFGSHSKRELKKIKPIVDKIEALEDSYRKMTDAELKAKTGEFKARLAEGETLDDILPEAFATVREASDRVLGMDLRLIWLESWSRETQADQLKIASLGT